MIVRNEQFSKSLSTAQREEATNRRRRVSRRNLNFIKIVKIRNLVL